jgi:hypothetical protein
MYIGDEDGSKDVPDPIAPIDIVFFSLEPTRILISSPFITSSGPRFMFIPLMFMPGIWPIGLAIGLAEGIGMFICGVGEGDGAAICIPGILSIDGVVEGDAFGVGVGVAAGCRCCAVTEYAHINMSATSQRLRIVDINLKLHAGEAWAIARVLLWVAVRFHGIARHMFTNLKAQEFMDRFQGFRIVRRHADEATI